ncbi:MAG: glutaredoxin family protein [Phormidesmis sp.]
MKTLILYSKPGCHLCEGLQEKLETLPVQLEIRDITTNEQWFQTYQYEVPVLCHLAEWSGDSAAPRSEQRLPRLSPRASVAQVARMIQTHLGSFEA